MQHTNAKTFDGPIHLMYLENQSYVSSHAHDYIEFVYILSGSSQHRIGNNVSMLKSGDYFVVDYGTSHDYFSTNSDLTIINCLFLPELLGYTYTDIHNFNSLVERYFFNKCGQIINGPTANCVFKDDGSVKVLLLNMLTEYRTKQNGYIEMLRLMLCQILINTVRLTGSHREISAVTKSIIDFVNKSYMQNLTLSSICNELHYTVPYVSAKFRNEIGMTFTDYLQNTRIENSCRLLIETNDSISEIAQRIGYSNTKFFNKIFKSIIKTTPSKFRKTNKRSA